MLTLQSNIMKSKLVFPVLLLNTENNYDVAMVPQIQGVHNI